MFIASRFRPKALLQLSAVVALTAAVIVGSAPRAFAASGDLKIEVDINDPTISNDPHVDCDGTFAGLLFNFNAGTYYFWIEPTNGPSATDAQNATLTDVTTNHIFAQTIGQLNTGSPPPNLQVLTVTAAMAALPANTQQLSTDTYSIHINGADSSIGTSQQTDFLLVASPTTNPNDKNAKTKVLHIYDDCSTVGGPPPTATPELGSGELLVTGLLPILVFPLYRRYQRHRDKKATEI